ncbi:uncharacterized protein TOT_010000855 [Theileria orientalis strain Shintoku]|uniref:C2H2-type domain-containing protein n=1 Tax=Theileria orientalis strain Shintoku TaxID=869250 RepID=J4DNR1_THEOR|nr:uncharacterized protein TOT_010000855 [Theileria orientalis strain Shintoku]BAM39399.1 uncharacterized protein TOT_010000855 [Theileria orientalis strain Shintoku]|eukprot:XP_009689700.1 uncharacterized protein TOT_010000855 [Theileria orientalis strain Shintoku]
MMMLEYKKEPCTHNSFNLATSLFCNCGIPLGKRYRNFPCYHLFCEECINKDDSNTKCKMCESLVEIVEELHPNEEIFICTVPNCKQGFLNFPSLKAHAKISHSVNIDTIEEFYEKFGDLDVPIPNSNLVTIEKNRFKQSKGKRNGKSSSPDIADRDSTLTKSPKTARKDDKTEDKQDKLEILM